MTHGIKREARQQSGSPITYWWNEFLFSRPIDFDTPLTPEDCASRLCSLAEAHKGLVGVTVDLFPGDDVFRFDIRLLRGGRGALVTYTTARADGHLTPMPDSGTRVQGATKFGWVYYVNWLFSIVYLVLLVKLMTLSGSSAMSLAFLCCFYIPLIGGMILFYIRQSFTDRRVLQNAIRDALDDPGDKSKRKRA